MKTTKKYRTQNMSDISNGFSNDILEEFVRITKKLNCFIFCSNKRLAKVQKSFNFKEVI